MAEKFTFTAASKALEAPDLDPGIYDARFDGIATRFIKGGQYGDGDRLEWQFTLLDDKGDMLYDEGEPIEVTGLTSMSTNLFSKTVPAAVRYLKALMTPAEFAKFSAGESFAADDLIGRVVQVEVEVRDNGWPRVTSVLPARVKREARRG